MSAINPSPAQLETLLEADQALPVVMINLLRYRAQAEYPQGVEAEPCSGRDAYARYGAVAARTVAQVGGEILWMAQADQIVIGPPDEAWDDVVLVRYPSREAFRKMIGLSEYQAAVVHREAGLADTRLIATSPQTDNLSRSPA